MPTQQMLQDRYEENLRRREEARSESDVDAKRAQFLEDERLALMMQNEEFMAELRSDRDFISTLQAEQDESDGYNAYHPHHASNSHTSPYSAGNHTFDLFDISQ